MTDRSGKARHLPHQSTLSFVSKISMALCHVAILIPLSTVPAWDYDPQFDVALISILQTDISLFLHEIAKSLEISA